MRRIHIKASEVESTARLREAPTAERDLRRLAPARDAAPLRVAALAEWTLP